MHSHFLSSPAWAAFQTALGRTSFHVDKNDYQFLAIVEAEHGTRRLYCPYSPHLKQASALDAALTEIENLGRQQRAWYLRIEPIGEVQAKDLVKRGYRRVKSHQPDLTWLIDLKVDKSALIAQMASTKRNIYHNYYKKGLKFAETSDPADIEAVLQLIEQVAKHKQVRLQSSVYLRHQAKVLIQQQAMRCFVVRLADQIVAGALVYDDHNTRYYAHAAADYAHRRLQANIVLVAELIMDAKDRGLKFFDFYGITDSQDPKHPWAGFTEFKKSFGGYSHAYLGTWEKPLRPVLYWCYRRLLAIYRHFR